MILQLLLILSLPLLSNLKSQLQEAKPGEYIVTEWNQTVTLLAIRSFTPETLLIEEISGPSRTLKNTPSWPKWVEGGAPGHTSWSLIEIDPQSGEPIDCFSFSKSAWIRLSKEESFLSTLLNLPLTPQPLSEQKRIGPPPLSDEPDRRQIWMPPKHAHCDIFQTTWPKDSSPLSGETILLYFSPNSPLPCWILIETTHLAADIQVIDQGTSLPSFHSEQALRRPPEFIGSPQSTETGLRLTLKCSRSDRDFDLFAVDTTTEKKEIYLIPHTLIRQKDILFFEIDSSDLSKILTPGHAYRWLAVPASGTLYAELHEPFYWDRFNTP